jgi:hypothetical protein
METGYMFMGLWVKLLQQVEQGSTIIPAWRGESTLHPMFSEFMEIAAIRKDLKIVLVTNGTHIEPILKVLDKIDVINVSIHGPESLVGYENLLAQAPDKVIASIVDTEDQPPIADRPEMRVYKEHTVKGQWGKVKGATRTVRQFCSHLDTDIVVAWDGKVSRCCYYWPCEPGLDANKMTLRQIDRAMKPIRTNYPDEICSRCDQWQGEGKTL